VTNLLPVLTSGNTLTLVILMVKIAHTNNRIPDSSNVKNQLFPANHGPDTRMATIQAN